MSIHSLNENLNDAFNKYYPKFNPITRIINKIFVEVILLLLKSHKKILHGQVLVNERIVEYPQILRWIQSEGTVLDIGCVSSRLPIQLASLGYEVHGLDTRSYPFAHTNFYFHQADIFQWSNEKQFDIITLISVIEHFGLGGYGDLMLENADKTAVDKLTQWLKTGGQLLVSLPFGVPTVTPKHRIYDLDRLKFLFSDYEWVTVKYYRRVLNSWIPSTLDEISQVESRDLPCNGVAILNLRKSHD